MSWRNEYLTCSHCHGKGYHGSGSVWDEDTRRSYPQDCGCCAGKGEHAVDPDYPGVPDRYPCYS